MFFTILTAILMIVAAIALVGSLAIAWLWVTDNQLPFYVALAFNAGSILLLAGVVTLAYQMGFIVDDYASHCGPGTSYTEDHYYNPATKTVMTDWSCYAN